MPSEYPPRPLAAQRRCASVTLKHLLLLCTSLLGAPSLLIASDAQIEEIIVTGQKISRDLQSTPESVAVLTGFEIEERGIQTLQDLYNQTANVYDLGNNEGFGIRGVTNNSGSTGGGDGELATYFVDGVALTGFAKRFVPQDMWDVAQIEVLRGPQSTNLGRNSMMGAVIVSSVRPQLGLTESRFLAGLGNANRQELAALTNVALGETAALRLSGEYLASDGFIENPTRDEDDFDARENLTLRAKLLFEPTDRLSILGAAQYVKSDRGQNLFRGDLADDVEDRENLGELRDRENLDGYLLTLDVNYEINERWSLRSISSYLDTEYDRFDDDDLSPLGDGAFRGREAVDRNIGQELRLDYAAERLRGSTGFYYIDIELDNLTTARADINPALVGVPGILLPFYPSVLNINVNSPFFGETTNYSLFSEWEWDFQPNLSLLAGLRYEQEDQENDARIANTLSPATPLPDPAVAGAQAAAQFGPVVGAQVEAGVTQVNALLNSQLIPSQEVTEPDFDTVLGKLGLIWRLNDRVQLAALWSQGYRAGGAELSLSGRISNYDPETLDNFELSLRSSFWEETATFNANAYYGDWSDQQVTIGLGGNLFDTVLENAGESTIYGAEAEFRWAPNDRLDLFASLGYSRTEFDEYESVIDGDLSGNEFAFSPNWTGALGGTYRFGRFYVGANLNWQTESYADVQNQFELDERVLLNLQAGYEGDGYAVRFFGKNVTDEVYFVNFNTGLAPGSEVVRLGDPTEYGVQVFFDL